MPGTHSLPCKKVHWFHSQQRAKGHLEKAWNFGAKRTNEKQRRLFAESHREKHSTCMSVSSACQWWWSLFQPQNVGGLSPWHALAGGGGSWPAFQSWPVFPTTEWIMQHTCVFVGGNRRADQSMLFCDGFTYVGWCSPGFQKMSWPPVQCEIPCSWSSLSCVGWQQGLLLGREHLHQMSLQSSKSQCPA